MFFLATLGLGIGWSVRLGVGVSVEVTPHPAPSLVFKDFTEDFYALGLGVEEETSFSLLP